jgi:crotonobetainyl-CoA:carnitine CoA-transferase CaiB-like acyl-CoA transferase
MLLDAELPDGNRVAMPGITPKLSATPGMVVWPGPQLGAHTNEVLAALGYETGKIAVLRQQGII